ncbi:MAG: hypothetical protein ABIL02_06345 [candidate division WOR-3 bacterium]
MQNKWIKILKKEINSAHRICILGVGNTQRDDDGAGPLLINLFKTRIEKKGKYFIN